MLKFVHAADLHLDSPFVGLCEAEPEIHRLLLEATFKAFDNVIELCLQERVDFLLVAGDVYDGKDRSLRAQLRFREGLQRLSDAGIRAYVVHGNHDPLDGWTASLKWPDSVHIFGGRSPESIVYERDGEPKAIIHGISFKKTDIRENLALRFKRQDSPLFQVGLLHCNVGSDTGHEPYAPCSRADLESSRLDYWALGHVHKMQVLKEQGPCIVYSGNTQGRHINEAGPRGCFLVSVDAGGEVQMKFVVTDVVRWLSAKVPIDGIADVDGLIDRLQQCLMDVQSSSDERPTIFRLTLTGRGPMHVELCRPGRLDEYMEQARNLGASLSPFVWPAGMRLKTSPEIDVELRMKSQDIVGECLRRIRESRTDEARKTELSQCLDELFTHPRIRSYLEPHNDDALCELLESAEALLLDRFLGDQG